MVDETPIGNYAELEGSAEWIDRAAARLGVDPAEYLTLSYGRLFDLWREQHHCAAEDLTFAAVAASLRRRIVDSEPPRSLISVLCSLVPASLRSRSFCNQISKSTHETPPAPITQ